MLGPQDLSPNDLARIMTEQLGRPVRYERQPLEEMYSTLVGYGLNEEFVQGIVDMKRAKDEGLDAGVARTPETSSPTTFEQWCARTLKPAVLMSRLRTGPSPPDRHHETVPAPNRRSPPSCSSRPPPSGWP